MGKRTQKVGLVVLVAIAVVALWKWSHRPSLDYKEFTQNKAIYAGLFQKNCSGCHGQNGEGEDPMQPKGGMHSNRTYIAPALNGTGHSWHHAPALLKEIVTNGSQAQTSSMKGFQGKLTKEEIQGVIYYFQSLWPKEIEAKYQAAFPE